VNIWYTKTGFKINMAKKLKIYLFKCLFLSWEWEVWFQQNFHHSIRC